MKKKKTEPVARLEGGGEGGGSKKIYHAPLFFFFFFFFFFFSIDCFKLTFKNSLSFLNFIYAIRPRYKCVRSTWQVCFRPSCVAGGRAMGIGCLRHCRRSMTLRLCTAPTARAARNTSPGSQVWVIRFILFLFRKKKFALLRPTRRDRLSHFSKKKKKKNQFWLASRCDGRRIGGRPAAGAAARCCMCMGNRRARVAVVQRARVGRRD
jgi:hypothetical protein